MPSSALTGTHAEQGWPNSNYGISKLAVIALTRVLAAREAAHDPKKNFQINACCPGYCDTDMTSHKGSSYLLTSSYGCSEFFKRLSKEVI
jgi:carbonyl reductase 1